VQDLVAFAVPQQRLSATLVFSLARNRRLNHVQPEPRRPCTLGMPKAHALTAGRSQPAARAL